MTNENIVKECDGENIVEFSTLGIFKMVTNKQILTFLLSRCKYSRTDKCSN